MIETPQAKTGFIDVAGRRIAARHRAGSSPGLFWLGGFRSDMAGIKAGALDRFAAARRLEATRFDYSGHGESGGDFSEGTISRWLEEATGVFEQLTAGPQIVVGSSMGGWIALLMNRALRERGVTRIAGLVLVAPAIDMTEQLMRANFTEAENAGLERDGWIEEPSEYSDEPHVLTRALIEDGAKHLLFGTPIVTGCPVAILQGAKDENVPPAQAIRLMTHLPSDEATLTLVPDGDHRLSREEDLKLLTETVGRMVEDVGART